MFDEGVNYPVGKFYMTQKHMRVTDPCYNAGIECTHLIMNAMPGIWEAFTNFKHTMGCRNAELIVIHADHVDVNHVTDHLPWALIATADIGVDSGQAGFFDAALYPRDETGDADDKNSFYGRCARITCEQMDDPNAHSPNFMGAGCQAWGAVSSTGYGDGSYNLYVFEDNGQVVGAKLVFIPEEEDEEFDEDDQDEDEDEDEESAADA